MPKVLPGCSGGRLPGRSTEEKGREEGEDYEGSGERGDRNEIIKEVIKGIQKMDVDKSVENESKRIGGQDLMQRWDCSQIENEEEEESWQEGDQMAEQWVEEQHLEGIVERRRTEGSSLKLNAMQRVPELVVNERMSQGKRVKSLKEKKEVPGWSIEEMKETLKK